MSADTSWFTSLIRDIADYPSPGVTFRDITPMLGDGPAFSRAGRELAERFDGVQVDRVLGMEARGFIVAAPIAVALGAGFVPVRKAGKLPCAVVREVIDDVLATGGTAAATCRLVEELGGAIVGLGFLIEIGELDGRSRLGEHRVESLTRY